MKTQSMYFKTTFNLAKSFLYNFFLIYYFNVNWILSEYIQIPFKIKRNNFCFKEY